MSIITYPLNGVVYSAEDVATYLCTRTSGVYSKETNFAVSITGTRQITVAPGLAWINYDDFKGVSVCSREENILTVPEADNTLNRVDRVVLQFDTSENVTAIKLKPGTPAVAAQPPDILQNHNQYELGLCTISVPAGSTSVTAADITDTRADETVCGVMRDGVTGIPAATLIQRLRAEIDKLVDKGSFYNKEETDALLDELQKKVGASGQPIVVWSYYASFSSLRSYKYSIPDSVDYIVVKKDLSGDASQLFIPRGKTGAMGNFGITFAENGTLSLYADAPSGHTLYFVGYHYLTAADGVKFPYAVDTKSFTVNQYYGTSFTVDTNVDYIVMEWTTEKNIDSSSSSVTVSTKYSEIIARGTPDGATDSFSSSGTVKINSNGGKSVNIVMYHYATPEELNSKLVAAESAQADADALNLDQDYRLTLLELGVTDDETTETTA